MNHKATDAGRQQTSGADGQRLMQWLGKVPVEVAFYGGGPFLISLAPGGNMNEVPGGNCDTTGLTQPCRACGSETVLFVEAWHVDTEYVECIPCECGRGRDLAFERRWVVRESFRRDEERDTDGTVLVGYTDLIDRERIEDECRIECRHCLGRSSTQERERSQSESRSESLVTAKCARCGAPR